MVLREGERNEKVSIQRQPDHGDFKQAESGVPVADLCREHGMSSGLFCQWRSKYGGMDVSMMKCLKELEAENARLKKMYAEERIKAELRQEALEEKL